MSHAGPPAEPPQDPSQSGSDADPAGEPQPYSPYPDNWDSVGTPPSPPPAQNPYDQTNPYGQAQPGAYGQPGQQPYGQQPPYGSAPGSPVNPYAGPPNNKPTFGFGGYAGWFTRVGAYVIDWVLTAISAIPMYVAGAILGANTSTTTNAAGVETTSYDGSVAVPITLYVVGLVTYIGFFVWNVCIRQGRTGATVGKSVLAIRLVNSDLQPIGGGWCFLRYLLHIVDALPCGLGYLWPIWDSRKQTFADKIMNTFVIQATTSEPRPY
jgi:uncharacterized RDD family membrane protein YckC